MSTSPDSAPMSALEDAIRTVRGEVNDLAIQIAAAGDKPKEEVASIRELFELRKADLASLMSVSVAVPAPSNVGVSTGANSVAESWIKLTNKTTTIKLLRGKRD